MNTTNQAYLRRLVTVVGIYTVIVVVSAILILPRWWPYGFLIWLFVPMGLGLAWLIRWHADNTAYICPECDHRFMVSTLKDAFSVNMIDKKLLTCPSCRKRGWCQAISAGDMDHEAPPARPVPPDAGAIRSFRIQTAVVGAVYVGLWLYAVIVYLAAPETIPIHFDAGLRPDSWGSRSNLLILPAVATIFPLLQVCYWWMLRRWGYVSFVFPFLAGVNVISILVFGGLVLLSSM